MTQKHQWPRAHAEATAAAIVEELAPYTTRIEIAGSLRRQRPTVGDVEVLAIPKVEIERDMFGEKIGEHDLLHEHVATLVSAGVFAKRPSKRGHFTFGPSNKLLIDNASGIPVDLFTTRAPNWGMAMVVRTGPADFNIRLMSTFRQNWMRGHAYGGVTKVGPYGQEGSGREEIDCPDEETVFELLNWPYREPWERF